MYFSFTDNTSKMIVVFAVAVLAALFVVNVLYNIAASKKAADQDQTIRDLQATRQTIMRLNSEKEKDNQVMLRQLSKTQSELEKAKKGGGSTSMAELQPISNESLDITNISQRSTTNIAQLKSGMKNLQVILNDLAVARDELVHAIINDADEAIQYWQTEVEKLRKAINAVLQTLVVAVSAQEHTIAGLAIISRQQEELKKRATSWVAGSGITAKPTPAWYSKLTNQDMALGYGWHPDNVKDMVTGKSKRTFTPLIATAPANATAFSYDTAMAANTPIKTGLYGDFATGSFQTAVTGPNGYINTQAAGQGGNPNWFTDTEMAFRPKKITG